MSNLMRDPKGYYVALGVPETADADAIKAAFRAKAKRLHPDFNPSPIAAKQFHRLHEAYETLSDADKRAAYDRPWKDAPKETAKDAPKGSTWKKAEAPKAEAPRRDPPKPKAETRARPETPRSAAPGVDAPAVCKCGKVTAQPRYVIFDMVWGRLNRVMRRSRSGVFCRSCADRTAVASSLISWIAGWWAWPDGPRETVKALLNNIRGGRKPAVRNARLLMRQARAFRARGEMELARNAAEQALTFAATPELRREVDSLLLSLSAHPARPLKDRWSKPGWAPTAQLLPLAAIVAAVSMTATLSLPTSISQYVRDLRAAAPWAALWPQDAPTPAPVIATGRVYAVAVSAASLRTGPGDNYQIAAVLSRGNIVLVTEADPSGAWVRIVTSDSASGFLKAAQISPEVTADALNEVESFVDPAAPDGRAPD